MALVYASRHVQATAAKTAVPVHERNWPTRGTVSAQAEPREGSEKRRRQDGKGDIYSTANPRLYPWLA